MINKQLLYLDSIANLLYETIIDSEISHIPKMDYFPLLLHSGAPP